MKSNADISGLKKRLEELQFENNLLLAELNLLDQLMRRVGFSGGITALKQAAEEYCERESHGINENDDDWLGF